MPQITKPYGDFVNDVDVADANKVNSQINTVYSAINGNIGQDNLLSSSYSASATPNTFALRDSNGNLTVGRVIETAKSGVRATNNASQSVTAGTATKVLFQTVQWDNLNEFSSSRYVAKNSSTIRINASVEISGIGNSGSSELMIYKNGSPYAVPAIAYTAAAGGTMVVSGSALVQMNGTTDYIEIYVIGSNGAPVILTGTATYVEIEQIA